MPGHRTDRAWVVPADEECQLFTYFKGGLPAIVHSIKVKAQGFIECRNNGAPTTCPTGIVDGYADGGTQRAIGAASLLVEEQQNWGKS